MNVRCKFVCVEKSEHQGGSKTFKFVPVTGSSEENKSFWKWTPSGKLELACVNPAVDFEVDKEYYLDINPAVVPVPASETSQG